MHTNNRTPVWARVRVPNAPRGPSPLHSPQRQQRLVDADPESENLMVASHYAMAAKERGLGVITWTLERAGPGLSGFYYGTTSGIVDLVEGDRFTLFCSCDQKKS